MNVKLDSVERGAIEALRCLLMLFVVVIHTNFIADMHCEATAYGRAYDVLSEVLWLSNSLFFAISGYLFFRAERFDAAVYGQKMRRRWHTLVVPYLLWNTIAWGIYLFCLYLMPAMVGSGVKPLASTSLSDVLRLFLATDGTVADSAPINGPLWFLRNLIVLSAATPLYYFFFRLHRLSIVLLPLLALVSDASGALSSVLFFGLGCYLGIWKVSLWRLASHPKMALAAFLCLAGLRFVVDIPDSYGMMYALFKHVAGMLVLLSVALKFATVHPRVGKSLYGRSLFFV